MAPWALCLLLASLPAPGRAGAALLAPAAYAVDSTTLLNEAARRDKEVGYRVRAALRLRPVWAAGDELLLQFELESPQLYGRGKHVNADYVPLASVWDSYPHSTFYAHWNRGLVQAAYLDTDELIDIQNFKRSLISLFQFQLSDGEGNETDVTGECDVQYEALSETTVRKVKRACRSAGWPHGAPGELQSRRLTRYSLSAGALHEAHAEELHELGAAAAGAGLKARAWLRLTREPHAVAARAPQPSLAAALAALPAELRAAPLAAPPPADLHDTGAPQPSDDELSAAARRAGGGAPGRGGSLREARAALALLAALPAAPRRLAALLHDGADADQLSGLCVALGLAGSAAAHRAASAFLRLRQGDAPRDLAHQYFAALAQAERPEDAVVEDALALGEELRDAALGESALLAGAAAASRASPVAQRMARDTLARGLARCAADECRRVRVAALGNLRLADTAELLLTHAERGGEAGVAALDALDALLTAHAALPAAALPRLERLALGGTNGSSLESRAAALDLLLRCAAPAPFALPRVLLQLQVAGPGELLRLAWQRLHALAAQHEPVRLLLRLLPPSLRSWDAQAPAGTSSLLLREAARGAAAGGWRALLESRQLARGALLRRGRVRLLALTPHDRADDVLGVELWTRGLGALAGGADGDDDDDNDAAGAGLALSVGGARLRALPLFAGQAELLGHVWAGTASEPTPVLRALRPLPGARVALPLLGGSALTYARAALSAAALDADAQVSLWARTARTRLALRTALAARGEAHVRAAWGALAAHAAVDLEPRARIDADLDFYDGVALCVRVRVDDYSHSYNVTLTSQLGAARRRVRRTRAQRWAGAGRTLALGAPNDATCRAMGAARD